jgi:hypothetical protein
MNRTRVPTEFGPEARFEVNPVPPAPFRAVLENEFERLNDRLLRERLADPVSEGLGVELRRAANEAAGLAWVTAYPLLVFPALFEEKADLALHRTARQRQIFKETRRLLAA